MCACSIGELRFALGRDVDSISRKFLLTWSVNTVGEICVADMYTFMKRAVSTELRRDIKPSGYEIGSEI